MAIFAAIIGPIPCMRTAGASDAEPTQKELLDQIRSLQAKVERLQTKQDATDAANSQATAANVLNDARKHDKLMDLSGFTAGYSNGKFLLQSDDGNFSLHPWLFVQVRNTTTYRDNATATSSDTQNGFELPRMKLIFDGNVFTPDLTYQFIWNSSDTTGNLFLQDAWARYHIAGTPFAIEAGQIRNPLDHEQILYATKTLTPERSIVNNVLLNGDDIVKGAELSYGYDTPSAWRAVAAITSGERNFNTTFEEFPTNTANWGAAGRVTWKAFGNWEDYNQFTSLGDKDPLLVLGGGLDYTETGAAGQFTHVVDAQFNLPDGLALYGAYLGRYTRHDAGNPTNNGQPTSATASTANTYDSTFRLMGSYLLDQHCEPFVRYEYLHLDSHELPATANNDLHDFTVGFNYYFYGHRAKFTAAASYLPNGSPVSNTLGDLLTTVHGGNELIVQAQFQLIL